MRSGFPQVLVMVVLVFGSLGAVAQTMEKTARPVIVASKPFGESYLLAEIFAQQLEARGFEVDRRPGLGATEIAFQALRKGAIDVYPEYTGTGLLALLGEEPRGDAREVFRRVSAMFWERWGVKWLPPLGFENTYAVSVRRETAEEENLTTLSDLARVAPRLTAGFSPDFVGRPDGLPGLRRVYGLEPGEVRSLLQAVKYQALATGAVDVVDGYSTDGFIARYDLVVLEDDRRFFPPYEAAPLVGESIQRELPGAVWALSELAGLFDEKMMRRWNEAVEVHGETVASVAREAREDLGLDGDSLDETGASRRRDRSGLWRYLWDRRGETLRLTARHLLLVSLSLAAAIVFAVPLGLALERARRGAEGLIRAIGALQTIPGIALLAFMIPVLGIGTVPAITALFLYSIFPIVRNTYTGVREAGPDAVESATALGMTPIQVLRHVRLPLASPVIMAGIRTAAVINVGTATLAAFIGAGGLGDPIVSGLALSDTRLVLSGAIPAAVLALMVDAVLALAGRAMSPAGVGASGS